MPSTPPSAVFRIMQRARGVRGERVPTRGAVRRAAAGLALLAACGPGPSDDGSCFVDDHELLRPILVGDVARPRLARLRGSDCDRERLLPRAAVAWRSADSAVVGVTPDGEVHGLAPGRFTLAAEVDGRELRTHGFVVPPGWRLRLDRDTVRVAVGDTVPVRPRAVAADGTPLPAVPYAVATPEHLAWGAAIDAWVRGGTPGSSPEERPGLFEHSLLFARVEDTTATVRFVARRAGRTLLVAFAGSEVDTVHVHVVERAP